MSEYQKGRERGYELGKLTALETISDLSETVERLRVELASANEQLVRADLKLNATSSENEKLRVALKQFMAAYYEQMRKQGWSDLDVVNNDDYRAAAAALKETGDE